MARWSDLAEWRGPSINSGDGDGRPLETADALVAVDGLILHIAEGFLEGTVSWQKNPDANTSSHFIAGRAGGRAQMVDTHDRAWTQGAGNSRWISLECEGFTLGHKLHRPGWHELTPQQIEFAAQLFARLHHEHGVPLQLTNHPSRRGLGYHSMGAENGIAWGHSDCPGEPIKAQLPAIVARAVQIVHGGTLGGSGDDDMNTEQAAQLNALYQLLVPDPPTRVQGAFTSTGPDGRTRPISPLYAAVDRVAELVEKVAVQAGVDPAELAAIKEAARAGAEAGTLATAAKLAQAVAEELGDDIGLTAEQVQAAAERAVRKVLGSVDNPAPQG